MNSDEKKCPQCAETIKAEAKVCRFCGHLFQNDAPSNASSPSPPGKVRGSGKGCLIILGILVVLWIIGSLAGSGKQRASSSDMAANEEVNMATMLESDASESSDQGTATEEKPGRTPSLELFGPQANAKRSAQQYLDMTGFSRQGLIEQLSSDAGSGYSIADATAAVDSLTVDWNEQAARSAKQYLDMTGFSCNGLIEQLSSDAGSKYTNAQARYGARQAGAC